MSYNNDSRNLTKNSSGLLKDLWSICLSYFFSCFISWKATSGYFPAIFRLCFQAGSNRVNKFSSIRTPQKSLKIK